MSWGYRVAFYPRLVSSISLGLSWYSRSWGLITKYRVQSRVWRLPNYWPPTPSPFSEYVSSPRTRGGGVHTRRPVRGWGGGVNISEDARHWIGLLQDNPSTRVLYSLRSCTAHPLHRPVLYIQRMHVGKGFFANSQRNFQLLIIDYSIF
jgi:hypothetical protein